MPATLTIGQIEQIFKILSVCLPKDSQYGAVIEGRAYRGEQISPECYDILKMAIPSGSAIIKFNNSQLLNKLFQILQTCSPMRHTSLWNNSVYGVSKACKQAINNSKNLELELRKVLYNVINSCAEATEEHTQQGQNAIDNLDKVTKSFVDFCDRVSSILPANSPMKKMLTFYCKGGEEYFIERPDAFMNGMTNLVNRTISEYNKATQRLNTCNNTLYDVKQGIKNICKNITSNEVLATQASNLTGYCKEGAQYIIEIPQHFFQSLAELLLQQNSDNKISGAAHNDTMLALNDTDNNSHNPQTGVQLSIGEILLFGLVCIGLGACVAIIIPQICKQWKKPVADTGQGIQGGEMELAHLVPLVTPPTVEDMTEKLAGLSPEAQKAILISRINSNPEMKKAILDSLTTDDITNTVKMWPQESRDTMLQELMPRPPKYSKEPPKNSEASYLTQPPPYNIDCGGTPSAPPIDPDQQLVGATYNGPCNHDGPHQ